MELIPHHYLHVVLAGVAAFVLTASSLLAYRRLKQTEACLVPSDKVRPATIFEVSVEAILNLMERTMGERAWKYFPLIGALFIYIFTCNVMGLIPGLEPPTGNTNTNGACAVGVFLYYNYVGIRENGVKNYLKHFLGPVAGNWKFFLITIMFFGIETISHVFRPISLSVRLFGNMTGDHMVLGIFSDLVPLFVPIVFLGLGLFISFIQAFVFSLLSIIYIALATETEHH